VTPWRLTGRRGRQPCIGPDSDSRSFRLVVRPFSAGATSSPRRPRWSPCGWGRACPLRIPAAGFLRRGSPESMRRRTSMAGSTNRFGPPRGRSFWASWVSPARTPGSPSCGARHRARIEDDGAPPYPLSYEASPAAVHYHGGWNVFSIATSAPWDQKYSQSQATKDCGALRLFNGGSGCAGVFGCSTIHG